METDANDNDAMLNFREMTQELATIDSKIARGERDIPKLFECIPLDAFGKLLLGVPTIYPNIRAHFPTMASAEVQKLWTGASDDALLKQTVAFVRSLMLAYYRFVGDVANPHVLDFGCGYGRIMRLMYKYFPDESLYGVDPWDRSIDACRQHGMRGHLALSDWTPISLPFDGPFDLIYAFSVFTHLSEKVTEACLRVLRSVISESGLLAISIRPEEYWDYHDGGNYAVEMKTLHGSNGFAFLTQNRSGEATYGDTSMSFDYIRRKFADWRIVGVDWNACDHFQTVVFIQPTKL